MLCMKNGLVVEIIKDKTTSNSFKQAIKLREVLVKFIKGVESEGI